MAAVLLFPVRPQIAGWEGLAFWIALTLLGAAMPVRLPQGTVASVSAAPILAAVVLGGPLAAAVVTAIGTTDPREARGKVPWYGTLYNHAALVLAVVVGASVYELIHAATASADPSIVGIARFGALILAAAVFYVVGWILAVVAVAVRTGAAIKTIWAQDVSAVALSLIGLAPLGWLMAEIFQLPNGIGWWATPLFVVPLFTTRLAYHRYVETRELFEQTIKALAMAVDARDEHTRNHSKRVSDIAEAMCRVMNLPENEIEIIKWAGLLHDVGKIGVRDHILLKEGPLDRDERFRMNQHPLIGAEIVRPATQLSKEAPLILHHHEWFNGSGYPSGIEALDIELGARILGVADAYEAMTSSRPYRKIPLTHEQAIGELRKYSGIQFDPEIVPVLIGLDRSILDRPAERDDDLPSMRHQDDPRDRPTDEPERKALPPSAAAATPTELPPAKRRILADDVS